MANFLEDRRLTEKLSLEDINSIPMRTLKNLWMKFTNHDVQNNRRDLIFDLVNQSYHTLSTKRNLEVYGTTGKEDNWQRLDH